MKLIIRRNPDWGGKGKPLTGSAYLYSLQKEEGEVPYDITDDLMYLNLTMGSEEVNKAKIHFKLDDVDIRADVLAEIVAHQEVKEGKRPPPGTYDDLEREGM